MGEQQYQTGGGDPIETLYSVVKERGLYTKSLDEFRGKYSDPENMTKLYDVVSSEGLYTKTKDEFFKKYSVQPKPKKFEYGTFPQPIDVLKSMKNQVGNPESFEGGRKPEPEQQPDPEHDAKIKGATDYLLSKEATPEAAEAAKKYAIEKQKRKQEDFQLMVRNRGEKLDSHFDEFSKVGQDEFTNKLLEVNSDPVKKLAVLAKAKEKSNPQEAQEINSNLFLVTHREYAKTPEDKKKLYEGAEKVKSGEYKLSGSGQLIKPLGFAESAVDAWNRKNEAFDRYEKLQDPALAEEVYAKYDKDLATFSPLDPIGVPDGIVNTFIADAAGMPVLPLVAGAVTGILTRNPEAAQIVGGAVGGADFGILAGVGKHEEAYKKAIMEGKSKEEARDIADRASSIAQASGTVSGAAMAFVPGAKLSPILKNSGVINIGKQIVNNVGKEAFQGLQLAGIVAGSKVGENIALNAIGEKTKIDEGVWDASSGIFMFHIVNQAVMKGSEALGKPLLQKAKVALAKMPKEELQQMQKEDIQQVQQMQKEDIQQGLYTAEEAAKANEEIDALRPTVESLPTNMKEEATLQAHKIIQKRNELSSKLEVADPALHPSIKERVKALNEEIVALANDKKPRDEINDKVGDFFASKEEPVSEKTSTVSEGGSVGVGGDVKSKLENEGFKPTLKPNGANEFILQVDDTKPNGKRSVGVIGLKTIEIGGKKLLSIGMTNVREGYEGKGLATNMYRYLMENLPEGYDGILSPKETRWNNEQIPKIHEKLSKEYDKTELNNGDIVFKNKAVEQSLKEQSKPNTTASKGVGNAGRELKVQSGKVEDILGLSGEDADALSIIHNADLTPTEKQILWRQYKRGVMNLNDVKNHSGIIDLEKLNSEDIGKWARAALEKQKSKGGKFNAEDIDFEELPTEQSLKEQPVKNEQTKEATKVPIQAEAESADIGKVAETVKPTEKTKKQVDTIEDFDKELSDIFNGKYDKLAEGGTNKPAKEGTAEDYLSKGKAVLSEMFPNVEVKAYETSAEYEAKEGRPKGSAGMFDPATNRIALNLEAIKAKGVENTIFHEVIHPIVNEVIGKNEEALGKLYDGLESMKNEKGMEAVWEHMNQYFNRGVKIQKVEAVTEFLSLAADGKIDTSKLSKSTVTKIIDWVNKAFEALGIDKRISTADDLKSLSDSVIKALQEGDTSALKETLGKRKESKASEKTIADLEVKRDAEISKLMKPEVKMELVSVDDLINAKDPIAAKEAHTEIKDKYKEIRRLVDCLWAMI